MGGCTDQIQHNHIISGFLRSASAVIGNSMFCRICAALASSIVISLNPLRTRTRTCFFLCTSFCFFVFFFASFLSFSLSQTYIKGSNYSTLLYPTLLSLLVSVFYYSSSLYSSVPSIHSLIYSNLSIFLSIYLIPLGRQTENIWA